MVETKLEQKENKPGDWVMIYVIFAALSLTVLGLVMLFSAGVVRGAQALLTKQVIWLILSLAMGAYATFINLDWLRRRAWLIFGICMLGLVLTLVPGIGVKVNGAQRWIGLGPLRVQPSEFAKIGLVLILAAYFASRHREIKSFVVGFFIPSPSRILRIIAKGGVIKLLPNFPVITCLLHLCV